MNITVITQEEYVKLRDMGKAYEAHFATIAQANPYLAKLLQRTVPLAQHGAEISWMLFEPALVDQVKQELEAAHAIVRSFMGLCEQEDSTARKVEMMAAFIGEG